MAAIGLESFKYKKFQITSHVSGRVVDIANSVVDFNYCEDLMSPVAYATARVLNTSGLYSGLPIRCGDRVEIEFTSLHGTMVFSGDRSFYVGSLGGLQAEERVETFDMMLYFKDSISNETTRVIKKYDSKVRIDQHIRSILLDVLKVKQTRISKIEETLNTYGFHGNFKKPLHTCVWLCPKSIPITGGATGTSGKGITAKAKGSAGYFFYETYDGYNFRSVQNLVSGNNDDVNKRVQTFTWSGLIEGDSSLKNTTKIISYFVVQNNDLLESLLIGLYSNRTYFFDPYKQDLDVYNYTLKEEMSSAEFNTLSRRKVLNVPDQFTQIPSRILSRTSDRGMFTDSLSETSGRENADIAKATSRYNLVFSQSININIALNTSLRVGETVKIILPKPNNKTQTEVDVDDETSGLYVISALRHSCVLNENLTALSLIRDSYGLYRS